MNQTSNHRSTETQNNLNRISGLIVDAAVKVHMRLGPGLFEEVYKQCLMIELEKRKLNFKAKVCLPVIYDHKVIDIGYRLDLLVESQVIVELKSVNSLHPIHKAQLLTYLKLSKKRLGLLLNFNVPVLPKGIVRIVN